MDGIARRIIEALLVILAVAVAVRIAASLLAQAAPGLMVAGVLVAILLLVFRGPRAGGSKK